MEQIALCERIKYYRKLLGISYAELADGKMSESLIRYIENGKRKITPSKAIILVHNICSIAKSKRIKIDIDITDLLFSDQEYANKVCNKTLSELGNLLFDEKKYMELLILAQSYNLDGCIEIIYKRFSEYFYEKGNYEQAIIYCEKRILINKDLKNSINKLDAMNFLATCYYMLNDSNKAIFHLNQANEELTNKDLHDTFLLQKILYNLALCHQKIKDYDVSLIYIDKLFSTANLTDSLKGNGLLLKANIYFFLGRYEESLELYTHLSKHNSKLLPYILNNMAVAFDRLNKIDKSMDLLTQSINYQLHQENSNITFSIINIAHIFKKLQKYKEAIIFFNHAFNYSIKYKQIEKLIESFENLFELYSNIKKLEPLDKVAKNLYLFYIAEFNNISKEYIDKIKQLLSKYDYQDCNLFDFTNFY